MKQPIAINVDASNWLNYKSGTFRCSGPIALNHGVVLVGIDFDENVWIVRNSFTKAWGEEGYIKINVGDDDCGLTLKPSYPT